MSTSINIDVSLKRSMDLGINTLVRTHTNTNTVLRTSINTSRTSINTSACKGLSVVLTAVSQTSIGAHVCKGLSSVFMVMVVFC